MKTKCIEWKAAKTKAGYGVRRVYGKNEYVHRLAYRERHGEIPHGKVVMHLCHNPACYNADHLIIGTIRENLLHSAAIGKMHQKVHPKNYSVMRKLREQGESVRNIGDKFGVTGERVYQILKTCP